MGGSSFEMKANEIQCAICEEVKLAGFFSACHRKAGRPICMSCVSKTNKTFRRKDKPPTGTKPWESNDWFFLRAR
jgi:hypothetical protein